jgi:hypothetical protein
MKSNARKLTGRQQQWLLHLRRAEAHKTPLAQYCRAKGLNVQSLYNARHELLGKGKRRSASRLAASKSKGVNRFVAVRLAASPSPSSGVACRVQLKDVVIECASLPPSAWLAELAMGAIHAVP